MNQESLKYIQEQLNFAKHSLKSYIGETGKTYDSPYNRRDIFYKIEKYINRFTENNNNSRWIIMPGLRRTGKTTVMAQLYFSLLEEKRIEEKNIIYISLDRAVNNRGLNLKDVLEAYEYILGQNFSKLSNEIYIFIDEVQADENWGKTIKSCFDRSNKIFFLLTGSSALNLQTNADVTGRAEFEKIYPMNFCEFQFLKNNIARIDGLKEKINQALYYSNSSQEVFEKLKKEEKNRHNYWSQIEKKEEMQTENELKNYIETGTLPFAINKEKARVYNNINLSLNNVIFSDVSKFGKFDIKTLNLSKRLLFIFADAQDNVSAQKISSTLGVNRMTITRLLEALEKAEILIKIPVFGSNIKKVRLSAKYLFMSPSFRASLLNISGDQNTDLTRQGRLLEDILGGYFYREIMGENIGSVSYDPEKNSADFILEIENKRKIVFEVGKNKKSLNQLNKTIEKAGADYGVCVSYSSEKLELKERNVNVPLKLFLLS